jgi:uncharacterized membrane protein YhaH (DUF805 family)
MTRQLAIWEHDVTMLFSFRGRVTRTECFIGVLAWLAVLAFGVIVAAAAMSFGHPLAGWIYVAIALLGMVSLQALMTQRAHDIGRGYWSALLNPFSLLRRGTSDPNAYGAVPPQRRVWWLLGALVLLAVPAYAAAALTFDRLAAPHCAPYVVASAASQTEAERRWKEAVISTHGADYLDGITLGRRNVCRDAVCTVSARACRRP